MNFPPRCGKTNLASIVFPAQTWTKRERNYLNGPSVRFLCGSYNDDLALQNSLKTRRLIQSPWYQARWGNTFNLRDDQNTKTQFDNDQGGSRRAASVRGSLLGLGGDIIVVDDPHNTEEAESEVERSNAMNWWKEVSTTRLNDPKHSPLVVVMQRLHQNDVSGVITASESYESDWVHLMIPARHDPTRHCVTVLKWDEAGEPEQTWEDPRTEPDELMWPERLGDAELANAAVNLGPYMYAGRYQQMPQPAGGGIIKEDWWQLWPPEGDLTTADGRALKPLAYPEMDFILASVDTAMTTKEESDESAMTIWGIYRNQWDMPCIMLMEAWAERMEFHALVNRIMTSCTKRRVDRLLVEAKNNGYNVVQEILRLTRGEGWSVVPEPVKGDKTARLHACVPVFAAGQVFAPDRKWAERVIDQCAMYPKGQHDDLCDSTSQAINHMRRSGLLLMPLERQDQLRRQNLPPAELKPRELYDV